MAVWTSPGSSSIFIGKSVKSAYSIISALFVVRVFIENRLRILEMTSPMKNAVGVSSSLFHQKDFGINLTWTAKYVHAWNL